MTEDQRLGEIINAAGSYAARFDNSPNGYRRFLSMFGVSIVPRPNLIDGFVNCDAPRSDWLWPGHPDNWQTDDLIVFTDEWNNRMESNR